MNEPFCLESPFNLTTYLTKFSCSSFQDKTVHLFKYIYTYINYNVFIGDSTR